MNALEDRIEKERTIPLACWNLLLFALEIRVEIRLSTLDLQHRLWLSVEWRVEVLSSWARLAREVSLQADGERWEADEDSILPLAIANKYGLAY
ncbi:hypothetical protein Acr_04g0000550 [Actinidia rufa]|uniref:Uncharacterized protein n=1 Tax=Actinidia rufa TaxID=165716 RepID=A0A7J0EI51_9ERIC|nr:hypothetical protein Acr_04g0000550 [Actinidia rufa]